jgi:hypothetical protein
MLLELSKAYLVYCSDCDRRLSEIPWKAKTNKLLRLIEVRVQNILQLAEILFWRLGALFGTDPP